MIKNLKKGQLYILIALILGVIIYLLISQTNVSIEEQEVSGLQQTSENYITEANRLLNTLQGATPGDIARIVSDFTDTFVYSYAKPTDPEFGLVYVLHNKEKKVVIENYLATSVVIKNSDNERVKEVSSAEAICVDTELCIENVCCPCDDVIPGIEPNKPLRWCKNVLFKDRPLDYIRLLTDMGIEDYTTGELAVQPIIKQGDQLVVSVDYDLDDDPETSGIVDYYFTVGDEIELSAITRRTDEGDVEIYQSE